MPIDSQIIEILKLNPNISSSVIVEKLGTKSLATVKRALKEAIENKFIVANGAGRATKYQLSNHYKLFEGVDIEKYYKQEIDDRKIIKGFNFSLLGNLMGVEIFTQAEQKKLQKLQKKHQNNTQKLSQREFNQEQERLAIDLSWKSSQIEGNTYSLLETENLIKEQITAKGKTHNEATMLLNHKSALDFIVDNPDYLQDISVAKIENIHMLLTKNLNIDRNIRQRLVAIQGTNFKPLDNEFQIKGTLNTMCNIIKEQKNTFAAALIALVLISYIQPFSDGNKRTARIVSNAILISQKICPLSYRTVDSLDYKKAMLLFYEQNNISVIKDIFVGQFAFAVKTYFQT
ncbi:MAG: cell filamentation protein Fic [Gammaproteobacteria bacterium]|nr:MAG: cell filamentation protein Fic [Gammaproteobacteria bacterium]